MAVSPQIKTFTEQIDDPEFLNSIAEIFSESDRVIFLGFAFHPQNMKLIGNPVQAHTEFLATGVGISKSDQRVVTDEIARSFSIKGCNPDRIRIEELACADLLAQNWRTVTSEPKIS